MQPAQHPEGDGDGERGEGEQDAGTGQSQGCARYSARTTAPTVNRATAVAGTVRRTSSPTSAPTARPVTAGATGSRPLVAYVAGSHHRAPRAQVSERYIRSTSCVVNPIPSYTRTAAVLSAST